MHRVPLGAVVEVLYAAHLSSYVQAPIEERGGIMLIGPPGILKTALLGVVDRRYSDAITLSDLNVQTWARHLREQFASGEYRTLVLPELAKIYERNPATAANLEGVLRALVAEGFRYASFEDPNVTRVASRGLILAAMTSKLHAERFQHWQDTGFARRFIFAVYRLADAKALDRAISAGTRVAFPEGGAPPEPAGPIPDLTTPAERTRISMLLQHQPRPNVSQKLLLMKILTVLRWWYRMVGRSEHEPWQTLEHFGALLGKEGGELVVERLESEVVVPVKKVSTQGSKVRDRKAAGRHRRKRGAK